MENGKSNIQQIEPLYLGCKLLNCHIFTKLAYSLTFIYLFIIFLYVFSYY